jgi:Ni,Fe-hydrogenase maturation factor
VTVLVGGVGELFQSDLDFGRVAVDSWSSIAVPGPSGLQVLVEELHYGAVAVAQRLQELRPAMLVLLGAVRRGRSPGQVERRRVDRPALDPATLQVAVTDAVTGYVGLDLVVEVAGALDALPPRTVAIEVEPESTGPGEGLSDPVAAAVAPALRMAYAEAARAPLLELADHLLPLCEDGRLGGSAALSAMRRLLEEISGLDRDGRWGATFARRDQLRAALVAGDHSDGMDHRDWALWWALVEEVGRLQAVEGVSASIADVPRWDVS